MRVELWGKPDTDDIEMTILPVGHDEGANLRSGLTAAGAIAAFATLDSNELARQCPGAAELLTQLADGLAAQRAELPNRVFELDDLTETERRIVADVLGEGEVHGVVALPDGRVVQIQESVLAGLWRVRGDGDAATAELDYLEIGTIPDIVRIAAEEFCAADVAAGEPPEGAMNVMPVIAEIRARGAAHRTGMHPHVMNFTLLPMTPADMAFLQATLGNGPIQLFSRGYGTCRVLATAMRHVWSVQFTNAMDTVILDTLEIGDVPEVVRAADEDFEDSAERLSEIIEAYFR